MIDPAQAIIIGSLSGLVCGLMIARIWLNAAYWSGRRDGEVSGYKDGLRRRNGLKYEEEQ